jgi:hypothetical protein
MGCAKRKPFSFKNFIAEGLGYFGGFGISAPIVSATAAGEISLKVRG